MAGSILAQGAVAFNASAPGSGLADIFAPSVESLAVHLNLGNINAASQNVYVYVLKSGGTVRFYRKFTLAQYESGDLVIGAMNNGDTIQAVTDANANAVYYTVDGVQ